MDQTHAGLLCAVVSFLVSAGLLLVIIPLFRRRGLAGPDMNKADRRVVAEMGGIAVVLGLSAGVCAFYLLGHGIEWWVMAVALATVGAVALVGLWDDLFTIRRRFKTVLPFFIALPFAYVIYILSTGDRPGLSILILPYYERVELGWLILIIVPLGITSAANATNMLEGMNGLAAGLSFIIVVFLIAIAYMRDLGDGLFLLFPMTGALLGFLVFNVYPAKVFPGDVLTLSSGAVLAAAGFLGQLKFVAGLLLLPMIVEFVLKFRGRVRRWREGKRGWGRNFGTPDKRGILHYKGPIESLTHVILRLRPMREWQVVAIIWGFEIAIGSVALWYVTTI